MVKLVALKFIPTLAPTEVEKAFAGSFTGLTSFPGCAGGQGIVFKATANTGSQQPVITVALKIYYPGSLVERTRREVQALSRLKCETLVKLCGAGHITLRGQKCMYVATEFVDGEVLLNRLTRGPLPLGQTARIGRDVALAIHTLWQERVVHRDIKPQNIMLTKGGGAVLIDLGVARHLALGPLTTLGKTWGTEGYMSPEQANALRQLSCKSDVFALGIVLLESLVGAHPTGYSQLALSGGGPLTSGFGLALPPDFVSRLDSMLVLTPHGRPNPDQIATSFSNHC